MASSSLVCGVCAHFNITIPSISWCSECGIGLCQECKDHHSLSQRTQDHNTVAIRKYKQNTFDIIKRAQSCSKHDGEKYTMYCRMHECLCCGICHKENHMKCRDFDKLSDVLHNIEFSSAFHEIEQTVEELTENIKRIRNNREDNLKKFSEGKRQIEQAIRQTRITINNHLDEIQDDIIKKLDVTEKNESKQINELLELLKEKESEITEYRTIIQNIKQHFTDLPKFIAMKELENNVLRNDRFLQSVIETENCKERELSYTDIAAMQDFENGIKSFGEVKVKTKPCNIVLTRRKNKQAQIFRQHVSSKSVEHINMKHLKTIHTSATHTYGCCKMPDGRMAFTDYFNNCVRVLNMDGTTYFRLTIRTTPCDIAYNSEDNTLLVTSGGSGWQFITIIDVHNKEIKKKIPVHCFYYGIVVKEGNVICSMYRGGIQLINLQTNQTHCIVVDNTPTCCFLAAFGDKLYHTDRKSSSVMCYDIQGTFHWKFKNVGVLNDPRGISIDNDGNVYVVGNASKNVVVISSDGQQHKEILTISDGLFYPFAVDYDRSSNELLVANFKEKAMIFTMT